MREAGQGAWRLSDRSGFRGNRVVVTATAGSAQSEIAYRLWDERPDHNPNIPSLCRLRSRFGAARARRNDFGVGVPVSSSQQRTSQRRQHGPQPTPRCSIDLRFARCPTGTDLSSLRVQAARRRPRGADDWPSRVCEVAFSTRLIGQSGGVRETRSPPDRGEYRRERRTPVRSPLSILYSHDPRVKRPGGCRFCEVGMASDAARAADLELAVAHVWLAPQDRLQKHGLDPRRVHLVDVRG